MRSIRGAAFGTLPEMRRKQPKQYPCRKADTKSARRKQSTNFGGGKAGKFGGLGCPDHMRREQQHNCRTPSRPMPPESKHPHRNNAGDYGGKPPNLTISQFGSGNARHFGRKREPGGHNHRNKPGSPPKQPFARRKCVAPLRGKGHCGNQQQSECNINSDREHDAQAIPGEIKAGNLLYRADSAAAEMHKLAGFVKLGMQKNRLNKEKLQQAGNQACCSTSEQRAGKNAGKHRLVAGKAG